LEFNVSFQHKYGYIRDENAILIVSLMKTCLSARHYTGASCIQHSPSLVQCKTLSFLSPELWLPYQTRAQLHWLWDL